MNGGAFASSLPLAPVEPETVGESDGGADEEWSGTSGGERAEECFEEQCASPIEAESSSALPSERGSLLCAKDSLFTICDDDDDEEEEDADDVAAVVALAGGGCVVTIVGAIAGLSATEAVALVVTDESSATGGSMDASCNCDRMNGRRGVVEERASEKLCACAYRDEVVGSESVAVSSASSEMSGGNGRVIVDEDEDDAVADCDGG